MNVWLAAPASSVTRSPQRSVTYSASTLPGTYVRNSDCATKPTAEGPTWKRACVTSSSGASVFHAPAHKKFARQ